MDIIQKEKGYQQKQRNEYGISLLQVSQVMSVKTAVAFLGDREQVYLNNKENGRRQPVHTGRIGRRNSRILSRTCKC